MRRPKRHDVKKWLLICFPFGLYLMWKKKCRWPVALKAAVTALFACAVLAIILVPAPERQAGTQVRLVGAEPNAKVFGPEMPSGYNIADYNDIHGAWLNFTVTGDPGAEWARYLMDKGSIIKNELSYQKY